MPVFANAVPGPLADGMLYAQNLLLPASEGDLYTSQPGGTFDPIPVLYNQCAIAVVEFNNFNVSTNTGCYVVMQTSLNDNSWFDLAWCTWTGTGNSQGLFYLSAGAYAAAAFQQTRQPGTPPVGNGSNSCPLGGRIRFVGKGTDTVTGSSASSNTSGTGGNGVFVNILVKLLGLR